MCGARASAASTLPRPTEITDQVGLELIVHHGGVPKDATLPRGPRLRQLLPRSICTSSAASSAWARLTADDDRDCLAHVPHFVMRQKWLTRTEEFVFDDRGPFARQRYLSLGHRREHLQQTAPSSANTEGCSNAAREVDGADAGVRHRAPEKDRVRRARQGQDRQ